MESFILYNYVLPLIVLLVTFAVFMYFGWEVEAEDNKKRHRQETAKAWEKRV